MTAFVIESGQFVDTGGKPFLNGKIYIGTQGQDPKLNPITIFSDRALTVVLANPQTLDSSGRSGTKIWIPGKYSIKIEDSTGSQQLQELDNGSDPSIGNTSLSNIQGTNALTATADPTITAYVNHQQYVFTAANTNTAQATINIDGVGIRTITGAVSGVIVANAIVSLFFNSTTNTMILGITPPVDLTAPGPIGGTTPDVGTFTQVNTNTLSSIAGDLNVHAVSGFNLTLQDDADNTKQLTLDMATIATATERTWTFPNLSGIFVGTVIAQTLTNKTMTSSTNSFDIAQGDLKTTTGDVSSDQAGPVLITGAGGDYGFWPTIKSINTSSFGRTVSPSQHIAVTGTYAIGQLNIGSSLLQRFTIGAESGAGTFTVRSRFVQASPPYDIGDGVVHSFIWLLIDNSTGKILAAYHAADPVWANNGATIKNCLHCPSTLGIDIPFQWEKNGKLYRKRKMIDTTKEFFDPDRYSIIDQEMTNDFKNSDMALIPHPFQGNDMTGKSIVLIDPNDPIVERAEIIKEHGEVAIELFFDDYIRFGNEHLTGRKTPSSEVMVVKPTWKNTA